MNSDSSADNDDDDLILGFQLWEVIIILIIIILAAIGFCTSIILVCSMTSDGCRNMAITTLW